MGGHRSGGNVKDSACKFAGDLEHIWDHQEEPLAGSEGGREGARL